MNWKEKKGYIFCQIEAESCIKGEVLNRYITQL